MADLKKYLDYEGLGIFLTQLKEHIEDKISAINGENLNLKASGADNPTITSQIEDLWSAIGSTEGAGGSIAENIQKILGEYVKSISAPTTQSTPLKLVITEGVEDDEGRFIMELKDNGLSDTLGTLTSSRVSKITPNNEGGAVTLSVNQNTGDVEISINSADLTERVEGLENNRIKSVKKGTSIENYLKLGVSTVNLDTSITIDDSQLKEAVENMNADIEADITDINNDITALQEADNVLDERLDVIEDSYVKSVKVTGSNGITASTTSPKGDISITISGQELKESIEALGKVVNLMGVYGEGVALNTISGDDGDFIIVGQKEYVYWSNTTTGVDGTKWVLLGDTTQLSQDVSDLTESYNSHIHSVTAKGQIENTFIGNNGTTKSLNGLVDVSYISAPGTLPTKTVTSVASDKHTHTTSVTAKGRIENTFTGNNNTHKHDFEGDQNTTSNASLTISYAEGKLSIKSSHVHTVVPTGTISNKTITPTGTVTSTFIGEAVNATSGNPSDTKEIGSITGVGTLPNYTNIEVASGTHTHTFTPAGEVTSTFIGEEVNTSTKK